jgi:hypothetical protein
MNNYRCSHPEDLDIFDACIKELTTKHGVTIEIGVHEGGGSKRIIDAYKKFHNTANHYHIGVDPFGSAPYIHTDEMFSKGQSENRYGDEKRWYLQKAIVDNQDKNFIFLQLEAAEYFKRFHDGYPLFINGKKYMLAMYDLVHLDGLHAIKYVVEEVAFFDDRLSKGGFIVFDDIDKIDMDTIHQYMTHLKYTMFKTGTKKTAYRKT